MKTVILRHNIQSIAPFFTFYILTSIQILPPYFIYISFNNNSEGEAFYQY